MDPHEQNRPPVNKPSAPPVPRELLSARPAMTRVVPRSPDSMRPDEAPQSQQPPQPRLLTPEEEAERQQRLDYIRNLRAKETGKGKKSKLWLVIMIIIMLLLVAGGIGYAFWKINKSPKAPATETADTSQQQTTQPTQNEKTPEPVSMKDYDSTNFALSLKYPSDWTLNDTANNLTIASPVMKLPGADGQEKSGAILIQFRHKQSSLAEYSAGGAVAVLDSKNVTYTAPSEGQRGTTYLSYLQYAKTTTKGALDSIYITGNSAYKKAQAVPQADITKVDPLVNVGFIACEGTCSTSSPATQVNAEKWQTTEANTTVETILKSLAF